MGCWASSCVSLDVSCILSADIVAAVWQLINQVIPHVLDHDYKYEPTVLSFFSLMYLAMAASFRIFFKQRSRCRSASGSIIASISLRRCSTYGHPCRRRSKSPQVLMRNRLSIRRVRYETGKKSSADMKRRVGVSMSSWGNQIERRASKVSFPSICSRCSCSSRRAGSLG